MKRPNTREENRRYYLARKARDPGYMQHKRELANAYYQRRVAEGNRRDLRVIHLRCRTWRRPKQRDLGPAPILWGFPVQWVTR